MTVNAGDLDMTANESAEQTPENPVALFFRHIWGVVSRPRSTIKTLVERRPILEAFVIILFIFILAGVSRTLSTSDAFLEAFELDWGLPARLMQMGVSSLVLSLWYIASLAILVGLCWAIVRVLGSDSSYPALFSTMGFCVIVFCIPPLIRFAIAIVAGFADLPAQVELLLDLSVSTPVSVILMVWFAVLCVFAVRYASGLSIARAIAAVVIPLVLIGGGVLGALTVAGLNILSRFD